MTIIVWSQVTVQKDNCPPGYWAPVVKASRSGNEGKKAWQKEKAGRTGSGKKEYKKHLWRYELVAWLRINKKLLLKNCNGNMEASLQHRLQLTWSKSLFFRKLTFFAQKFALQKNLALVWPVTSEDWEQLKNLNRFRRRMQNRSKS